MYHTNCKSLISNRYRYPIVCPNELLNVKRSRTNLGQSVCIKKDNKRISQHRR